MPDEYQRELFEEFKKEKGRFKKIADKITQRQPKFYIHLSLENIVFAAIIGIMCIVTAFALGVERGKRLPSATKARQQEATVDREEEAVALRKEPVGPKKEKAASKKELPDTESTFVIQLISYRQKRLAEGEKKRLLDKKIDAFIIPSGKWYQVCAGGYSDIKEVRKALEGFKKDYKGCFIRKKGE